MKWTDIDFDNRTLMISRSMEYRHSTGEWRIGEPKSKAGDRSIPLTDEAIDMLRRQKRKNLEVKDIADDTWIFQHWYNNESVCSHDRR